MGHEPQAAGERPLIKILLILLTHSNQTNNPHLNAGPASSGKRLHTRGLMI